MQKEKKTINYSMPMPMNQGPLSWAIWGIITSIMVVILITSIIMFSFFYKRKSIQIFSLKKVIMMSTFLSFFMIQSFIFIPLMDIPFFPFSFDSITTIAIGFIFGPIEAIAFGWIADSLRVLIHGWSYQFLASLMYPMIGLIAGSLGMVHKYKKELSSWKSFVIFQLIIISLFIIVFPLEYGMSKINWEKIFDGKEFAPWFHLPTEKDVNLTILLTISSSLITLIIMELLLIIPFKSKNFQKEMFLLTLIALISYIDRGMVLVIRPFTEYFWGSAPYYFGLYTRILSSTYLIPTITVTSFFLIKTSLYVLELK